MMSGTSKLSPNVKTIMDAIDTITSEQNVEARTAFLENLSYELNTRVGADVAFATMNVDEARILLDAHGGTEMSDADIHAKLMSASFQRVDGMVDLMEAHCLKVLQADFEPDDVYMSTLDM